jgi:hypothetical protein
MTWFRCLIHGEYFPGKLVGISGLVGFYVVRFAEAANVEEAESLVVQRLRTEPRLALPPGHQASGIARVLVEEITEVPEERMSSQQTGFTWFPMNANE